MSDSKQSPQEDPQQPSPGIRPAIVTILFLLLLYLFFSIAPKQEAYYDIPYSQFKSLIKQQKVAEVTLRGNVAEGRLFDPEPLGPKNTSSKFFSTRIPEFGDQTLLPDLEAKGVQVKIGDDLASTRAAQSILALTP